MHAALFNTSNESLALAKEIATEVTGTSLNGSALNAMSSIPIQTLAELTHFNSNTILSPNTAVGC